MSYDSNYTDYSEDTISYGYLVDGQEPDKKYIIKWNYGDTQSIKFKFNKTLEASNCSIKIVFYNFRYEEVYSLTTDYASELLIYIPDDISTTLFKKGLYYLTVLLLSKADEGDTSTLIHNNDCCIEVI